MREEDKALKTRQVSAAPTFWSKTRTAGKRAETERQANKGCRLDTRFVCCPVTHFSPEMRVFRSLMLQSAKIVDRLLAKSRTIQAIASCEGIQQLFREERASSRFGCNQVRPLRSRRMTRDGKAEPVVALAVDEHTPRTYCRYSVVYNFNLTKLTLLLERSRLCKAFNLLNVSGIPPTS